MGKQKSIFDQVFGRTFETINIGEGTDPIKIDSTSIIHIPGVIKHWQGEIENRKKEIIEYENRGYFEKFIDLIKGDDEFDEASGEELYDLLPTESAEELMEEIEKDPTDVKKRLNLVILVARKQNELSIEDMRDLFLQATVSCCFGELSNFALLSVLKTQEAYLSKLLKLCKIDHQKLEKILNEPLTGNIFSKQRKKIELYQTKISRNMSLIQFYINFTRQGIIATQSSFRVELNLADIQKAISAKDKIPKRKINKLFTAAISLLSTMRYAVLLHHEIPVYVTQLSVLDPQHPLPPIISARLHRTLLLFLTRQREFDEDSDQLILKIKDRYELARTNYLAAIKKTAPDTGDPLTLKIRKEYTELVMDITRLSKMIINPQLRAIPLGKHLEQAAAKLSGFTKDKEVKELINEVQELLADTDS